MDHVHGWSYPSRRRYSEIAREVLDLWMTCLLKLQRSTNVPIGFFNGLASHRWVSFFSLDASERGIALTWVSYRHRMEWELKRYRKREGVSNIRTASEDLKCTADTSRDRTVFGGTEICADGCRRCLGYSRKPSKLYNLFPQVQQRCATCIPMRKSGRTRDLQEHES